MSFITDFIFSAIRDIKGGKHSEALALFQFTAEHADRRKNKIIFRKCQFILGKILCQFCQANSVIAQKVLDIVKVGGMLDPTHALDLEGHYMTLLEMLNSNNRRNFASPNESLPSKSVGRCKVCSAWQFSSIREAKLHVSILHPKYKKSCLPANTIIIIYLFKVDETAKILHAQKIYIKLIIILFIYR